MIRLNSIFHLMSFGNFHIHQLFTAFLGLTGLLGIYSFFENKIIHKKIAAIVLFCFPSILIWGSGLLKETLGIFFLGMLLLSVKKYFTYPHKKFLIIGLASIGCWLFLKAYALFILLPFLSIYIAVEKGGIHPRSYGLLLIAIIATFIGSNFLDPHYSIPWLIYKKQSDFLSLMRVEEVGSALSVGLLEWNIESFFWSTPKALFNVIFYKLPWKANNMLELFSLTENYVFIALSSYLLAMGCYIKEKRNIVLFSLGTLLFLFLLTGYTTPILGAIVRYRILGLPFWWGMVFVLGKSAFFSKLEEKLHWL